MMPILEQSPVHHHHGHGHQTFYHQQHISEQTNKLQLTLILPNGVPSVITVDANTPMMDLLVQAASLNKLNPSGYSLVVLDSNQHVIHFKANQTVGQIGSSTISLLPKETQHPNPSSKTKSQPFEITVRLQVNLPDAQKILLRIDPTLPLFEIKEQICKQKKYINSNQYTLRLPNKLDQPLLLGLSLAEYKTNELTLIHDKQIEYDQRLNKNQMQSFDRLYRTRSESQPPKETIQEVKKEQQQQQLTNIKQNHQINTIRPSHTSLHAYWNDPNFDTQSQISSNSSIMKKRRAPRPPGHVSPNETDPQIVYIPRQQTPILIHSPSPPLRMDHHQSHESLQSENTKKKRKAPIVIGTNSNEHKKDEIDKTEQQQNLTNNIARPGLEPPPPPTTTNTVSPTVDNLNEDFRTTIEIGQKSLDEPQKIDLTIDPIDSQRLLHLLQTQTPTNAKLVITTKSPESINNDTHSPNQIQTESSNITSTIIPQQEEKSEQKIIPTEIIKSPQINSAVPKPPRQNIQKEKKSSTINGLLRIINDHNERAYIYQNNDKQQKDTNENISYFRVAKSRCGKFETENRGFVNNSLAIFDATNQQKLNGQQKSKNIHSSELSTNLTQQKSQLNSIQHQTQGKQAYDLLKKYEKQEEEEQVQSLNNTDYLKTTNEKEKSPIPIQLEVTERTTHITVTVESDRKQLITRTSPILQQQQTSPGPPPILAPKPFGKTITEYRTIRRIGSNDGETTTTVRNETISSNDTNKKRLTSIDNDTSSNTNSTGSHDALMESIRRFGGSQNLGKK